MFLPVFHVNVMLGVLLFLRSFDFSKYTSWHVFYWRQLAEGNTLPLEQEVMSFRVVSQHGCRCHGKHRALWSCPAWSIPAILGMIPAFSINLPGAPHLFLKTNRSHSQQHTVGLGALTAKRGVLVSSCIPGCASTLPGTWGSLARGYHGS